MTHDASHSYTYDAEGRVTAVDAGSTATYYYNAQGYRVHRAFGASSLEYLYDLNGNVVSEIQSNGALNASYLYFGGNLVAEYASGTTYFVHKDHLGSTRLVTKLDKSISDSMDYLPFGEQIAGASGTSHKFTGDERDPETNLDHTDFRQYSSALGRWITPDPGGTTVVDPTNPQSWNCYAYVLNDPLGLIDLLGLCGEVAVTGVDSGGTTTVFVGAVCPPSDSGAAQNGDIGFGLLLDTGGAPNLIYRGGGHGNVRFGFGSTMGPTPPPPPSRSKTSSRVPSISKYC
jgi:RHS repeat-associated protein